MAYVIGLANGLKDEDPETRVRVAKALMALEDPRATLPLVEALGDPCGDVRRAAARALSWVGDERERPTFIKALRDGDDSVRLWAAAGLERIGDASCVDALVGALGDPYESVRNYAVQALARIGDMRAVEPLIQTLDDEDSSVRSAALVSLREDFGVEIPSDFDQAFRQMSQQVSIDGKMALVLNVVSRLEHTSGVARDEELYRVLETEHGLEQDEVRALMLQLLKKNLIHWPKSGFTQICV